MSKKQIEILKDLKEVFEKHKIYIQTNKMWDNLNYIKIYYTEKRDNIIFPQGFVYVEDLENRIRELLDE